MAPDTKLLLVPAAGATRCFLCGWLVARAGMLLGSHARPGAGLLTARPAALGMALAGCCVLWHGLRVGLGRLRGLASDGAAEAALAGAGVGMALARWAPGLASAQTELHAAAVRSALQSLGLQSLGLRSVGARRAADARVAEPRWDHVGAIVPTDAAPRGRSDRLGALCVEVLAPTAVACAASWWLLTARPSTLPRGVQRWLSSLGAAASAASASATAAAATAAATSATSATSAATAATGASAAAAEGLYPTTSSWCSVAEAARRGGVRGARAHLYGATPAAVLLQHRALRRRP